MKKLITRCKYNLKFNYYITDDGKVWSERTQKYLSFQYDKNGYVKVQMRSTDNKSHRYSIHRLVLENFKPVEKMENLQVNHIDGNKKNNNLTNLEWTTSEENIRHAIDNNLRATINGASKLTPEQVIEIYRRATNGERNSDLGKEFNIHPDQVGRIKNKKSWKEITSSLV